MDIQIEEDVLGLLLLKPELFKKIVIADELFLDLHNKFIFNLLKKQFRDTGTVSIVGIAENYKHCFNEKFKYNDTISKLTLLVSETMPIDNFDYYQELLLSRYVKNKMLLAIDEFKLNKISQEELLDRIHKLEMKSIKTADGKKTAEEIFKLITEVNKNIQFRFKKISDAANIQEHDLVIVAARPGVGKTAFLLNLAEDLSKHYNCLFFSMEMSEKQVYSRLISINTTIEKKYLNSIETKYQKENILNGCKKIDESNIKIFSQGQTISSIRRKIINESKDGHVIAFVDYVGLIGGKERNKSIYEHITEIVKELRQISLDYDCTIFLAAQLNRNSEKSSEPKLSDLKESGELEQSATTVLFLHDENHDKNMSVDKVEMTLIIPKNRDGRLGKDKLLYNKLNQRFYEIER
ncbi:MAG: AAA family ATPase [Bacilli bacterium]|nr:AAA family ATPase [Bacilli bacterium]